MLFFFNNALLILIAVLAIGFAVSVRLHPSRVVDLRRVTLGASTLALAVGVLSCLAFDKSNLGFQFLFFCYVIPYYNIALTFGADGLSMVFLLLTLFIFPVLFLSS